MKKCILDFIIWLADRQAAKKVHRSQDRHAISPNCDCMNKQTNKQTETNKPKQTNRNKQTETNKQTNQTNKQTETNKQARNQTNKQTNQTNKQTETNKQTINKQTIRKHKKLTNKQERPIVLLEHINMTTPYCFQFSGFINQRGI